MDNVENVSLKEDIASQIEMAQRESFFHNLLVLHNLLFIPLKVQVVEIFLLMNYIPRPPLSKRLEETNANYLRYLSSVVQTIAFRSSPNLMATQQVIEVETEEYCSVCLARYWVGDVTSTCTNGHVFHAHCLSVARVYHNACPLCRSNSFV